MIKKFSIVPDILKLKGIKFWDEKDIEKSICTPLKGKPENVFANFQPPFLIIDTFAKKTARPENIKVVDDMGELKKLGFIICSIKASGIWFRGQKVANKLRRINNPLPGSNILRYIPPYHKCEMDVNNKIIRLCGRNAGKNGYGAWLNLDNEEPETITKPSIRPQVKKRILGRYV